MVSDLRTTHPFFWWEGWLNNLNLAPFFGPMRKRFFCLLLVLESKYCSIYPCLQSKWKHKFIHYSAWPVTGKIMKLFWNMSFQLCRQCIKKNLKTFGRKANTVQSTVLFESTTLSVVVHLCQTDIFHSNFDLDNTRNCHVRKRCRLHDPNRINVALIFGIWWRYWWCYKVLLWLAFTSYFCTSQIFGNSALSLLYP